MSGGVDSSVSAALLKQAGYDVTGVFIKVWHPDFLPCSWREERLDAMRVCAVLNIPFMFLDLEDAYKKGVADYMIAEYQAGRTPNPDVMCNKTVKFGAFYDKARELGADFVATGHYAQVRDGHLFSATDKQKDQSYFLWTLKKEQLEHILFPIGHLEKKDVRDIARKFCLPVAEKKDSQGLCFVGKVDLEEFLSHFTEQKPGDVLDQSGKKIGTHNGSFFYTIGERHGFTLSEKTPNDRPFYIVAKNHEANTITVSHRNSEKKDEKAEKSTVVLENIGWVGSAPRSGVSYLARIRYRQPLQACTFENDTVTFDASQDAVTPGQSLVLYDARGEECLGGGVIS